MKKILVFGAGMSAYYTIRYLIEHSSDRRWDITIADAFQGNLDSIIKEFPGAKTALADVQDDSRRSALINGQNIVISLLPASFHILIARDCIAFGVHLITPSYISAEMMQLDEEAKDKQVIFLNEIGLDPGIDHMSSMHIIDRLRDQEANIKSYKSYCGGLITKTDLDNPWRYKFSWNPGNVVRAGKDGGLSLINGKFHYVPYHRLFTELQIVLAEEETFESYFNRDSMHYIRLYGLDGVETFLRGTLRYPGYSRKWNTLVQTGLTSDTAIIETDQNSSWQDYIDGFMPQHHHKGISVFADDDKEVIEALGWLFDGETLDLRKATPAENLQRLLVRKWKMNPDDRDRVVMIHEFEYVNEGKKYRLKSWMDLEGEDARRTAMAKTVGLPLALAAELIAGNKIEVFGVILPTIKEVYEPMLKALENEGIAFKEEIREI